MAMTGLNHVAVTVSDIGVSEPWYRALIGADPVLDEHTDGGFRHVVWAFGDGTLFGIHQHDRDIAPGEFTEFRAGLDHIGFGVASRTELQDWVDRLEALGITQGGIVDAQYGRA